MSDGITSAGARLSGRIVTQAASPMPPECPDKRDGRAYSPLGATDRVLSTGLLENPPEVARDTGTVVASRLNVVTESRSMALRLHSGLFEIVDQAQPGQTPRTATAHPERAVCAGQ